MLETLILILQSYLHYRICSRSNEVASNQSADPVLTMTVEPAQCSSWKLVADIPIVFVNESTPSLLLQPFNRVEVSKRKQG